MSLLFTCCCNSCCAFQAAWDWQLSDPDAVKAALRADWDAAKASADADGDSYVVHVRGVVDFEDWEAYDDFDCAVPDQNHSVPLSDTLETSGTGLGSVHLLQKDPSILGRFHFEPCPSDGITAPGSSHPYMATAHVSPSLGTFSSGIVDWEDVRLAVVLVETTFDSVNPYFFWYFGLVGKSGSDVFGPLWYPVGANLCTAQCGGTGYGWFLAHWGMLWESSSGREFTGVPLHWDACHHLNLFQLNCQENIDAVISPGGSGFGENNRAKFCKDICDINSGPAGGGEIVGNTSSTIKYGIYFVPPPNTFHLDSCGGMTGFGPVYSVQGGVNEHIIRTDIGAGEQCYLLTASEDEPVGSILIDDYDDYSDCTTCPIALTLTECDGAMRTVYRLGLSALVGKTVTLMLAGDVEETCWTITDGGTATVPIEEYIIRGVGGCGVCPQAVFYEFTACDNSGTVCVATQDVIPNDSVVKTDLGSGLNCYSVQVSLGACYDGNSVELGDYDYVADCFTCIEAKCVTFEACDTAYTYTWCFLDVPETAVVDSVWFNFWDYVKIINVADAEFDEFGNCTCTGYMPSPWDFTIEPGGCP